MPLEPGKGTGAPTPIKTHHALVRSLSRIVVVEGMSHVDFAVAKRGRAYESESKNGGMGWTEQEFVC